MDERAFIEKKQPEWTALSETLDQVRSRGPRSLSREQLKSLGGRYRAVVSDLSYVRTQGGSDDLAGYLNELAGRAHGALFAGPSARARGIVRFMTRDFPALFRANIRYPAAAALIFFVGWAVSAYMIYTDPQSVRQMVQQKFGGSKHEHDFVPDPAQMSSQIMTNNIKVGIYAFASGITAGLLTIYIVFSNGCLIGAVAAFAIARSGPLRFWSLVLPHGVIELMAIYICGGAGLMIGSAIVAPGNLRRADAVRIAAGTSVKLFAGTLPMFVVAGIIEGFITPSVLPPWYKIVFAGVTAIGLVLYFGFAGRKEGNRAAPAWNSH